MHTITLGNSRSTNFEREKGKAATKNGTKPTSVKTAIVIVTIVTALTVLVVCICQFWDMGQDPSKPVKNDLALGQKLRIDLDTRSLQIANNENIVILHIWLGETLTRDGINTPVIQKKTSNILSMHWPSDNVTLAVKMVESENDTITCFEVGWTSDKLTHLEDRISIKLGQWYGGGETFEQHFTLIDSDLRPTPFLTGFFNEGTWGSKLEPYWLSSNRVAIHVDRMTPLWVGINDNKSEVISIKAHYSQSVYRNFVKADGMVITPLKYKIFVANHDHITLFHFQRSVSKELFEKPIGIPDRQMFIHPIWSTWAKFKVNISDEIITSYAREIILNGFSSNAQIEIDDKWQTAYGDLKFDTTKFPDAKKTVKLLHSLGFRVTLWTQPFINVNSATMEDKDNLKFCIRDTRENTIFAQWWNGVGAIIDFTDETAAQWFQARHKQLMNDTGIDSFKFDAGEVDLLTPGFTLASGSMPNEYTTKYAQMAVTFGGLTEIRTGWQTQNLPIFTRILDMDSHWGRKNGLGALIPRMLALSVIGYPFILPDMVGGNCYHSVTPDKSLYIRWLQANTFLPAIQFSIPPWDFDHDNDNDNISAVVVARDMMKLRQKWANYLVDCAVQSTITGEPIIRPTWWLSDSENALAPDQQFLLGDRVLVAPVTECNSSRKNVYLPAGKWNFLEKDNSVYLGDTWVEVDAPLNVLPYFVRVQDDK